MLLLKLEVERFSNDNYLDCLHDGNGNTTSHQLINKKLSQ